MKHVPAEKISSLFNEMVNLKTIYHHPSINCYAKAFFMAQRIEEMGYTAEYAWAFDSSRKALQIKVNGFDHVWKYHVAPAVTLRWPAGGQEPFVIDPSLFGVAVKPAEWGAAFEAPNAIEILPTHQLPFGAAQRGIPLMTFEEARKRVAVDAYEAAQYEVPRKRLNNF